MKLTLKAEAVTEPKYKIINVYLDDDTYTKLKLCASGKVVTVTRYISLLVADFFDSTGDTLAELCRTTSRFKSKDQVYSLRLSDRKKVGISLKYDLYVKLKRYSSNFDIPMSEVIRVLIEDDVNNSDTAKELRSMATKIPAKEQNAFEMYIDLG